MSEMIIPTIEQSLQHALPTTQHMQVMVYVQAEVLTAQAARRCARNWLAMYAGHLLQASNPELLLHEPLLWRFDVVLTTPVRSQPGTARHQPIGQMKMNARTGEIIDSEALIAKLTTYANSLTPLAA